MHGHVCLLYFLAALLPSLVLLEFMRLPYGQITKAASAVRPVAGTSWSFGLQSGRHVATDKGLGNHSEVTRWCAQLPCFVLAPTEVHQPPPAWCPSSSLVRQISHCHRGPNQPFFIDACYLIVFT